MADVIAVDRRTNAEMIHMRRVDNVLIPKRWIRAYKLSDDIRALIRGFGAYRVKSRAPRERDSWG